MLRGAGDSLTWKIENLAILHFMLFDRYEIHIQEVEEVFTDFCIVSRCPSSTFNFSNFQKSQNAKSQKLQASTMPKLKNVKLSKRHDRNAKFQSFEISNKKKLKTSRRTTLKFKNNSKHDIRPRQLRINNSVHRPSHIFRNSYSQIWK